MLKASTALMNEIRTTNLTSAVDSVRHFEGNAKWLSVMEISFVFAVIEVFQTKFE